MCIVWRDSRFEAKRSVAKTHPAQGLGMFGGSGP